MIQPTPTTPNGLGKYCLCLLLIMSMAVGRGLAAEPEAAEKQLYSVKSGQAASTLPLLARQGQVDVMFTAKVAKGVRTNAVVGMFTPSEALDTLLADTSLQIVEDRKTGAFAVIRVADEVVTARKPEPLNQKPKTTPEMNPKKGLFSSLAGGLAAVFAFNATPATAQQSNDGKDGDDVVTMEAFEIYGAAQAASVERQKQSNIIGSYLGSDALGDLPDDDLGEALSRLAGVNVIGGQGNAEGSVTIRGAEGQYNTIRINGASPANARLGSRNYDVTKIPSEMVSGVQIIKSITAEFPADSIGGSVNVETANAFDLGKTTSRYKVEYRSREQGDHGGWGANIVHSSIGSILGGEDNFGMLFNINYTDEDLVDWSTQNRFLDDAGRVSGIPGFAEQTDLATNPDAATPIWDRFDPNEVRTTRDELTFNASFDFKLSDETMLYFRPWFQKENDDRDSFAFRIDRLERAFSGNWWFMDDAGNALGDWVENDNDPTLGSAGDTFVQQVDGSGNVVVTPNFEANRDGRIDRIITGSNIEAETYTFDFGGETALDDGLLEYRLLFSSDEGDNFRRQYRFQERFDDGRAGDRLRASFFGGTPLPDFTVFEVTERRGHVPSNGKVNVFGDANRTFNNTSPQILYENVTEDVVLASVDLEKELNNTVTLKTGVRLRSATRDNVTTQLFFSPEEGGRRVYPAGQFADPADGGLTLWDGKYADTAGPFVRADPAYAHFFESYQADPSAWEFARSDLRDAADTAVLKEDVFAAYLQGTFQKGDWTLVTGLRFEKTKLDTTWKPSNFVVDGTNIPNFNANEQGILNNLVQAGVQDLGFAGPDGSFSFGDIVDDINRKNDYDNILPSAVLTYRAGESGHVFRLAYTNTLTRPDYRELVPFDLGEANRQLQAAGVLNLTSRDDEFDLGNPNLVEQTSVNFDAAWEYYFGPNQRNTFSVTYFSKDLEDFLQEDTFRRDVEMLIDSDDPSLGTEFITSDTNFWSNASSRRISGIEVSGYFNMKDLLPGMGFLEGLSFVPNYARITGDQTDPIFDQTELENGNFVQIGEAFTDSLTNQAKEIYNLQFIYERQRFNVRLSYNYISRLQRTPSTAAISAITFDRESESVDLSIQYRLFKDRDTRLFFEADNLTDTPGDERYIGSTPGLYTTSYATYGRRYVFGIRGSF